MSDIIILIACKLKLDCNTLFSVYHIYISTHYHKHTGFSGNSGSRSDNGISPDI